MAYLISFFTIGIIWVNHHAMMNSVLAVTRALLYLNLLLLAVVVAIPFATSTLADYLTRRVNMAGRERGGGPVRRGL